MAHSKTIYLGVRGSVIAVEADSGRQLWTAGLKGSEFVNVVVDGDQLYAATRGEIFCLDPKTGSVRWHNPLKGFGWGMVTIAGESISPGAFLPLVAEKIRRDREAAAAASSST